MEQKLVYINFESNVFIFYTVKIEQINGEFVVVVNKGKLGNKGSSSIIYRNSNYTFCKNEFWRKVNEKKMENFKNVDVVNKSIKKIFGISKNEHQCSLCGKRIDAKLYGKIDKYLRGETEVDSDEDHPLCNKVACFSCQSKHGVYKGKQLEKN